MDKWLVPHAIAWLLFGGAVAEAGNALLGLHLDPDTTGAQMLALAAYRIARGKSS